MREPGVRDEPKPTADAGVPRRAGRGANGGGARRPGPPSQRRTLTTRQLAWRRFRRHKPALVGAAVLGVIVVLCILAGVVSRHDPSTGDILNTLKAPSSTHLFGTDHLGRDELARVLYGGRVSLLVGLSVAVSSAVIGGLIGSVAGYYGGWIDGLLMRLTDLFIAIPLLVVLILASRIVGNGVLNLIVILTLFFWMNAARIVRGLFLSLKQKEFVDAARAMGASNRRIIFVELLPNAIGPLTVNVTLGVAQAILTESALSFLGFGIQPPTPSWGNLLHDSQNFLQIAPWLVWFPGAAILLTVLAVNLLGDGLRDALDPHQRVARKPARIRRGRRR
jgi:peptide/nickel transport system permease protein